MKIVKSLTCLFALILVSACNRHSSATFSLSSTNTPSSTESSLSISSQGVSSFMKTDSSSQPNYSSSSAIISSSSNSSSSSQQQIIYYDGYYDSLVSWRDGEDLKNQLYTIIRNGYTPLSYTKTNQNYLTNINADHTRYDFEYLDVVYSDKNYFKTDTNKGWQREHAWCASLMCGSTTGNAVKCKGRATDFHNLFAADAGGNQGRGNKNYGYPDPSNYYYVDRTVGVGEDGYKADEIFFEPAKKDKGRLARAIFYMATMYKNDEVDTVNGITMKGLAITENPVSYVAGNNCAFAIGGLSTLLDWNNNYAVDYLEMQHNIAVYTSADNLDNVAQGNRNPFVDYPELVDYVFGSKKNSPGTLKSLTASASYLNSESDSLSHYAIKEAKREYSYGETMKTSDYKVVAVNNNFDITETSSIDGISNSLDTHIFDESDGETIEATISTSTNIIKYQIVLNPMATCSNFVLMSSSGINTKSHNVEQEITFDGEKMLFTYHTSLSNTSSFYVRNISTGGVALGSGNSQLTGLTIKTKESYTVDKAFIKVNAGNTNSSFSLIIKIGDTVLLPSTNVDYNGGIFKIYGAKSDNLLTGQISFVFAGSNALRINSIAFNQFIA